MDVDVWSDVVCPWCFIGKRRLERALDGFPHRDEVVVRFHSFQLDPSAPSGSEESVTSALSHRYDVPHERALEMQARVTALAAAEGLAFDLGRTRVENTLDAHRLLHLASERGCQGALKEALMYAYFCEGRRVGDPATLARIAVEAGLDGGEAEAVLADPPRYLHAVHSDLAAARAMGVRAVPFFVFGRRYGVSGAQPVDAFTAALSRAWMAEAG